MQHNEEADHSNFVAIKKILFDRNYVQREVPILAEITSKGKTDNIIKLIDRYLKTTEEKKQWQKVVKEYLYIVTDYLPYTIADLNISHYAKEAPNTPQYLEAKL